MKIEELKQQVALKIVPKEQMIWKLTDDSSWFIAKQYIHKIAKAKGLEIKMIDSFDEVASEGFVEDNNLYIYKVDELNDYQVIDNSIIICNKCKVDCTIIPKIEKWQFVDFLCAYLKGLDKDTIKRIVDWYEYTYDRVTQVDYFRLYNDMKKIMIYDPSLQSKIFEDLLSDGEYSTLSNYTIFDLSNALVKRETSKVLDVRKDIDYFDSKPAVWLLTILLNSFENVIKVQLGKDPTPESTGITEKQFYVYKKYNTDHYTQQELIKIYEMLTQAEEKYKLGGLTQDMLIDYLIVNILGV